MIQHPAFPAEAWTVTETTYSPEILGQAESVFALANGYLGMRGNLDEGTPVFLAGTYLNRFYESRPIIYGEYRYGFPQRSQTLLNVTDGKLIRLRVNGQPLDVRTGRLHRHQRRLDMCTATLTRELVWSAPAAGRVAITSRRLVSFYNQHLAAHQLPGAGIRRPRAVGDLLTARRKRVKPSQRGRSAGSSTFVRAGTAAPIRRG